FVPMLDQFDRFNDANCFVLIAVCKTLLTELAAPLVSGTYPSVSCLVLVAMLDQFVRLAVANCAPINSLNGAAPVLPTLPLPWPIIGSFRVNAIELDTVAPLAFVALKLVSPAAFPIKLPTRFVTVALLLIETVPLDVNWLVLSAR